MKYEYKGNIYNYVGAGKFKDSTGKWIDAIIYERDNHIYMREITDFIDKFKRAEEEDSMQEDASLRKQKTVTEMVQDQLGPGYVPGFVTDKQYIPAYEVECEDHAQDDGPWYVVESDKNEDPNIGGETQI